MIRAIDKKQMSPWRSAVLELLDEGVLNADTLARDLVGWLSDHDVKEFVQANDLPIAEDPLTHDEEDEDGDGASDPR